MTVVRPFLVRESGAGDMTIESLRRRRSLGIVNDTGAAAVEFAIVLTALLLILFGIIDFGRLLYVTQTMKAASREGARVAAVGKDLATVQSTAQAAGASAASIAKPNGVVTTTWDISTAKCTQGSPVTVASQVTFAWLTPIGRLPGLSSETLTNELVVDSSTTMRCE